MLRLDWDYPVYSTPAVAAGDKSSAKKARKALTREEALKYIAGEDPRPLLVLRECKVCNGTDDALLKGEAGNEKTYILSQWFHCVKLPADVLEENHPFHALFLQEQPEHLFVSSIDGNNHDPLESQTSRTELWKSMLNLLHEEYKGKPDASVKKVGKILNAMDTVDAKLNELAAKRDDLLEKEGPGAKKLAKIEKEIAKAKEELQSLRSDVAKASALKLKERKAAEAAKRKEAKAGL